MFNFDEVCTINVRLKFWLYFSFPLRQREHVTRSRKTEKSCRATIYRDLRPAGLSAGASIPEVTARLRAIRRSALSMQCTRSLRNCWAQDYGSRGIDSRQWDTSSVRALHFSWKEKKAGRATETKTNNQDHMKMLPHVNIDFRCIFSLRRRQQDDIISIFCYPSCNLEIAYVK